MIGQWVFDKLKGVGNATNSAISNTGKAVGKPFLDILNGGVNATQNYFKPTENVRLRDVVREIPKSTFSLARGIQTGTAQSGGSVGLSLYNLFSDIKDPTGKSRITSFNTDQNSSKFESMFKEVVFGNEPIKAIETRMLEANKGISSFADQIQSPTLKKASPLLSIVGVGGLIGMDFTGMGGEKNAAKMIAKMTDVADISKVLRQMNVAEDLILPTAKKMSGIKSADEISKALGKIDLLQKNTKISSSLVKPLEEKPLTPQDNFLNILKGEKEIAPKIEDTRTPVQILTDALKEAKPLRKEQEKIYTKERGEKIAKAIKVGENTKGEQGFYSQLSAMKGSMKEVEADFESLRAKLPQETIDSLFEQIKTSKVLTEWEKLPAGKALAKMFGEYGGKVPTKNEIEKLETVFGKETIEALTSHRSTFDKFKENGLQLANLPRSLMSSFDLSAPLRQGIFMTSKPKQFFGAFKEMFKVAGSEKAFNELITNINTRPTSQLMRDNRLAITNVASTLSKREEAFMSSWAEKIPVVGKGVKMSEQAYVGFLNKLRADVFDEFVRKGDELGIDDPKYLKDAANFINNATGRGSLKEIPIVGNTLAEGAPILNAALFSPKLLASRLNMLNPVFYAKLQPEVRKEAAKSLIAFSSIIGTSLTLAKMGGAEIETDARSSDFAKIKIGNTRYDIMGGFQQPIKLVYQEITGETKNSTTGEIKKLGQGYNATSRWDILMKFFENKESPVMSFVVGMLTGTNTIGEKFDMPTEIANRFVPIITQDVQDLYKEQGEKGLAMVIPALFGVGTQTYGGVNSFGLKGKDYPEVNSELDRLNISMGFPSTTVFNEDLDLKEYKELKEKTGKTVASVMKTLIDSEEYKQLPDEAKVKILERATDKVKTSVKESLFPEKKIKSKIKSKLEARGLKNEELEEMTEKVYSQIDLSQLPQD